MDLVFFIIYLIHFRNMKQLTHLYIAAFLALTLSLMFSCAKKDEGSASKDTSFSEESNTLTSSPVTISGKVQKGPYVEGTEITVRELVSAMNPSGNTFTGTIDS